MPAPFLCDPSILFGNNVVCAFASFLSIPGKIGAIQFLQCFIIGENLRGARVDSY